MSPCRRCNFGRETKIDLRQLKDGVAKLVDKNRARETVTDFRLAKEQMG